MESAAQDLCVWHWCPSTQHPKINSTMRSDSRIRGYPRSQKIGGVRGLPEHGGTIAAPRTDVCKMGEAPRTAAPLMKEINQGAAGEPEVDQRQRSGGRERASLRFSAALCCCALVLLAAAKTQCPETSAGIVRLIPQLTLCCGGAGDNSPNQPPL